MVTSSKVMGMKLAICKHLFRYGRKKVTSDVPTQWEGCGLDPWPECPWGCGLPLCWGKLRGAGACQTWRTAKKPQNWAGDPSQEGHAALSGLVAAQSSWGEKVPGWYPPHSQHFKLAFRRTWENGRDAVLIPFPWFQELNAVRLSLASSQESIYHGFRWYVTRL